MCQFFFKKGINKLVKTTILFILGFLVFITPAFFAGIQARPTFVPELANNELRTVETANDDEYWIYLPAIQKDSNIQAGEVVLQSNQFGNYYQYIPNSYTPSSDVIVIVHGTPRTNESALDVASVFIDRWIAFAEDQSVILVAPAFDQQNFASKTGAYGGYRGLYGREIGADEFVHLIVDSFENILTDFDGQFYLYGHSAGGQFVNRYIVRHPNRIKSAVVSAAGRYAYPNPNVEWHYGMAQIQRTIEWPDTGDIQYIDITPDPDGWLMATQLPITVVVGDQDLEPQPTRPGQIGTTRIEIGQSWVNEMNSFANTNGQVGDVKFVLVPGVGHSSYGLTAVCQEELFR